MNFRRRIRDRSPIDQRFKVSVAPPPANLPVIPEEPTPAQGG
jgi:hypothetical protein